MKATYTYVNKDGKEEKNEVKDVILAALIRQIMYPDGNFYSSFRIESRVENISADIDIIPGSKLEFTCE